MALFLLENRDFQFLDFRMIFKVTATKKLAFASYFCKMRVKILYWLPDGEFIYP
jgi:hypothetical protein